jgi:hypothetical protein
MSCKIRKRGILYKVNIALHATRTYNIATMQHLVLRCLLNSLQQHSRLPSVHEKFTSNAMSFTSIIIKVICFKNPVPSPDLPPFHFQAKKRPCRIHRLCKKKPKKKSSPTIQPKRITRAGSYPCKPKLTAQLLVWM